MIDDWLLCRLSAAFADWVGAISGRRDVSFATPSEAVDRSRPEDRSPGAGVPSARATNELQRDAWERLASLEPAFADGGAGPEAEDFRRLTSADHFERMTLRPAGSFPASRDPDVPYEAYMVFRHALEDLGRRQISPLRPLESGARQPAV